MAFSLAARNKIVDSIGVDGGSDWFSLHTGDPGTTGANEAISSPYSRKSGPFPAASGGESTNSGVTFDVPAGTYTHYGRWSAITGGVFLCGGPLPASEVFGGAGQYQLTAKIAQSA